MAEDVKDNFVILSTRMSSDDFGFFKYADELALPRVPRPMRNICSLMREYGCDLIVEEELLSGSIPGCSEETELLQELRPEYSPLNRRVFQVTFFRYKSGIGDKQKEEYAKKFPTNPFSAVGGYGIDIS